MYLLYTTEEEAWNRSEQEGIALGLAYHKVGSGTRYVTSPKLTSNGGWALPVDTYKLTEEEQESVVETVSLADLETL